jgi:predicted amidohydrolase
LRVALLQSSSIPGDVSANALAAARAIGWAAEQGARLVVFPELFLTGYDLELLERTPAAWLADEGDERLEPARRACAAAGATAVLGAAFRDPKGDRFIAAPVLGADGGSCLSFKEHIHGSETSLFRAGAAAAPFEVGDWRVAVGICFDAAHPGHAERVNERRNRAARRRQVAPAS